MDGAAEVELEDVIPAFLRARAAETHTCMPGRVIRYYPGTQTADVQPVVKVACRNEHGEDVFEDHPVCPNVPVRWFSCGPFVIVGRLDPDDHVDLHFTETDHSLWRHTGQVAAPIDLRVHSLSFAYATLGARPDTQPLEDGAVAGDATTPRLVIGMAGTNTQIRIDENFIELGKAATDYAALASLVNSRLAAIKTAFDTHTHATAGLGTPSAPVVPLPTSASVAATMTKVR